MEFLIGAAVGALPIIVGLITWFVAAKRRVRGEAVAAGEAQLELAEKSIDLWEKRLGWSPSATRFLATAFALQGMENMASVLELAKEIHGSETFEEDFTGRAADDPSIIGPALQASRFITSDELRELLGRILASDVGSPGAVSRRTVNIAENLGPKELAEFLKLRAAAWRVVDSDAEYKLVLGTAMSILEPGFISFGSSDIGVTYSSLRDLVENGLVSYNPSGERLLLRDDEKGIRMEYLDQAIFLVPSKRDPELRTGQIDLTKPGVEILSLFMDDTYASPTGYFEEACRFWGSDGWDVKALES